MIPLRRALISVSDKTRIVDFALMLQQHNVEILSTGGTAELLSAHGIPVREVSDYTQCPEMMDGRVKTLHPKIHGGILHRAGIDDEALAKHAILPIDLVVVNLYPFQQTMTIENIDIGGPTLIRAAAKNHTLVSVVVEHQDYDRVLNDITQHNGCVTDTTRLYLAQKAFAHTAQYEASIARYFNDNFPDTYTHSFYKKSDLRYGENPHQKAAFYVERDAPAGSISQAKQHQGKALSFNNIADSDAALTCVKRFTPMAACVIVKHTNPCGVALANTILHAYQRAYATDPASSFGGIIAFNQTLDAETAQAIIEQQFVEVIITPEITTDAQTILQSKPNIRVLTYGTQVQPTQQQDYKRVEGGLLIQETDPFDDDETTWHIPTAIKPDAGVYDDLRFAWRVAQAVKSNAIVYAKDQATLGIGAGQMSRIDSAFIAAQKAEQAHLPLDNAVMASDAFFPFRDSVDAAAKAGIRAIIQPGGSIRDQDVIDAANEAGIAMIFTGRRHFRH